MDDPKLDDDCRKFKQELTFLINRYSLERMSNTPDFILADYLMSCLYNFNITSNSRQVWYSKDSK